MTENVRSWKNATAEEIMADIVKMMAVVPVNTGKAIYADFDPLRKMLSMERKF